MENHASVTFDSGRIVRCWRDTVTQKYTNLPGIRELHDFLALKNPGTDAIMKVRDKCYTGTLKDTPMKLVKGRNSTDRQLTYDAKGLVKELSASKQAHLKQMCRNFIPQDRWHELCRD